MCRFVWWKAFPSRLLRAPLPLRAGGVPQRPQLSVPCQAPVRLHPRAGPPSLSLSSRHFNDDTQHSPANCLTSFKRVRPANHHNCPAWHRCANSKPSNSLLPPMVAPLPDELRKCLPAAVPRGSCSLIRSRAEIRRLCRGESKLRSPEVCHRCQVIHRAT